MRVLLLAAEPYRTAERIAKPISLGPSTEIGHRIVHVDADQRHATCIDSNVGTYRIALDNAVPDVSDRQTQVGILELTREALHVSDIWDHSDGELWYVSATRADNGEVVELARHQERSHAIVFAFMRTPSNSPEDEISIAKRDGGRVITLTLPDQPDLPYAFLESGDGERLMFVPLGLAEQPSPD